MSLYIESQSHIESETVSKERKKPAFNLPIKEDHVLGLGGREVSDNSFCPLESCEPEPSITLNTTENRGLADTSVDWFSADGSDAVLLNSFMFDRVGCRSTCTATQHLVSHMHLQLSDSALAVSRKGFSIVFLPTSCVLFDPSTRGCLCLQCQLLIQSAFPMCAHGPICQNLSVPLSGCWSAPPFPMSVLFSACGLSILCVR